MSDINKDLEKMNAALEKAKDQDRRKKIVDEQALSLREHKVGIDFNALENAKREAEIAKGVTFDVMSDGAIQKLMDDNDQYMSAAKHSMTFITKSFKGVVPFFRKNLILLCGDTGDGKSTTVACGVTSTIQQTNPATGKSCRVAVLTNEEAAEDFYNRITCHMKGWQYTNHDQFTDEQRRTFKEWIPKFAKGGRLTVIGDNYEGLTGCTTTVEGIEMIFEGFMKSDHPPDVVFIDYYQNVRFSKFNRQLNEFECQRMFAALMDKLKNVYPGTIAVMAQMNRLKDEEDTTPFNIRIKGTKLICDKATFICELTPERELLRSKWTVWKSRFTDSVGKSHYTGYDRGKFVEYDDTFKAKIAEIIAKKIEEQKTKEMPPGVIKKEKKEDDSE